MRSAVILGAGQMGKAVLELINSNRYTVSAVGDNDPAKHTADAVPPVVSVEEALSMHPDAVLISVMGAERTEALRKQAEEAGFSGEVYLLSELSGLLDIRGRTIRLCADRIRENAVFGSIAELGVYRGDTARLMNLFLPDRRLYLFDTFSGFDERDAGQAADAGAEKRKALFQDTSAEYVLGRLPFPEKAVIRKGYFPDTAAGLENERFALISLDPDLYAPTLAGLRFFYPRLSPGGMILLHDYNNRQFPGAKEAVRRFEAEYGSLPVVPLADLHGSCVILRP